MKQHPIKSYMPINQTELVNFRTETPFPDCEMDEILANFMEPKKKMAYDQTAEIIKLIDRQCFMESNISYTKTKSVWPAGSRDFLTFNHVVRQEGKCWLQCFSIEDELCPEVKGIIRMQIHDIMVYFEPAPDINGYIVKCDSTFKFGGNLPIAAVAQRASSDTIA